MAIETPLWLQAGTYAARNDRALVDAVFASAVGGGVTTSGGTMGLAATQRGAGANNSVDVAVGFGIIPGGDQANQGKYLVHVTTVQNVAFAAAPGSNKRIDLLVLQIRDPNAGGAAGSDAIFSVVQGSVSASPTAPAVPASSIPIAQVLRTTGDTSITTAMITDRRANARPPYLQRVTTTQRDALPDLYAGYEVFNTTTSRVEVYNGATWDPGVAVTAVDVQTFTGNGTWTKPANAKWVEVHLFGGGGGGGGGEGRAAGSARSGGGGGGGGAHIERRVAASALGSTVSVTVGAAGTGGAGGTTAVGSVGTAGGNSVFGNFSAFGGGPGGGGGSNNAGGGGGGSVSAGSISAAGAPHLSAADSMGEGGGGPGSSSSAGGSSERGGGGGGGEAAAGGGGLTGGDSVAGGTGGGAGGGVTSGNAANAGGAAGSPRGFAGVGGAGGAAAGAGSSGAAGTAGTAFSEPLGGGGGGGGAPHTGGTGGVGGAGAIRGGGGGGGGGGTNVGGAGGAGGRGEVVVITYF